MFSNYLWIHTPWLEKLKLVTFLFICTYYRSVKRLLGRDWLGRSKSLFRFEKVAWQCRKSLRYYCINAIKHLQLQVGFSPRRNTHFDLWEMTSHLLDWYLRGLNSEKFLLKIQKHATHNIAIIVWFIHNHFNSLNIKAMR